MNRTVLRKPLLGIPVVLTLVAGALFVGIGVAALASNSHTFGLGVAAMLIGYGAMLALIAFMVTRGHRWALGLVVASSLLHACAVGSFLTSDDRTQVIIMACAAPFVLATVVTSVWAVGRDELSRVASALDVS